MDTMKRPWLPTGRAGWISLVALALALLALLVYLSFDTGRPPDGAPVIPLGWLAALYGFHSLASLVAFATSIRGPYRHKAKPVLVLVSLVLSSLFLLAPIVLIAWIAYRVLANLSEMHFFYR